MTPSGRAATRTPTAVRAPGRVPPVLAVLAFVLALAGLVAAAYLSYEHATGSTSLACPNTGRINCAKVTTSTYSAFLGVPVAYLGVVFFAVMAVLTSPPAWRTDVRPVAWARGVGVVGGLLFVLYLVFAELYEIGSICLWCTSVHVITLLLFGVVVFAEALRE